MARRFILTRVLILCLLVLFSTPIPVSHAATCKVSSRVGVDATWDPTVCEVYVINNIVQIAEGKTLIIKPGTVIKFGKNAILQIDGTLIARGSAQSPIIFTSNTNPPAAGDWSCILFADTSEDAALDNNGAYAGGSIIQYANILYAGAPSLGKAAIEAETSSPYLDHNTISYTLAGGIKVTSPNPVYITNNTISSNTQIPGVFYGINAAVTHASDTPAGTLPATMVNGNTLMDNNDPAADMYGIHVQVQVLDGSQNLIVPVFIKDNRISGNTGFGISFVGSTPNTSGSGIQLLPALNGNSIVNNGKTGMILNTSGISGTITMGVKHNSIVKNKGGGILLQAGNATITENNFLNNESAGLPLDIRVEAAFDATKPVNAANNYWGTTSADKIELRIFHHADDAAKNTLIFQPFQTAPVGQAPPIPSTPLSISYIPLVMR